MQRRKRTARVIFHHSLSKDVSASEIRNWHINRGWSDIGYHFVIRADGEIEQGRSIELMGSHSKGNNSDSVGVCITGDFSKTSPTLYQYASAQRLINALNLIYGQLSVEYHHETCPGLKFDRGILCANTTK